MESPHVAHRGSPFTTIKDRGISDEIITLTSQLARRMGMRLLASLSSKAASVRSPGTVDASVSRGTRGSSRSRNHCSVLASSIFSRRGDCLLPISATWRSGSGESRSISAPTALIRLTFVSCVRISLKTSIAVKLSFCSRARNASGFSFGAPEGLVAPTYGQERLVQIALPNMRFREQVLFLCCHLRVKIGIS